MVTVEEITPLNTGWHVGTGGLKAKLEQKMIPTHGSSAAYGGCLIFYFVLIPHNVVSVHPYVIYSRYCFRAYAFLVPSL